MLEELAGQCAMNDDAKFNSAHGTAERTSKAAFGVSEWACWVYIFVGIGRVGEIIPVIGIIPLAKISILVWLMSVWRQPGGKSPFPLLSLSIVRYSTALLVLAVLSAAFSVWMSASVAFLRNNGLILALTFVLVCRTARKWEFISGTISCLVFCGTVLAVAALLTHPGGRLEIGTTYDTNDLAYVLVTLAPLALGKTCMSKGIRRTIFAGIFFLLVGATLLTQSRGGVLGLVTIFLLISWRPICTKRTVKIPRRGAKKKLSKGSFVARLVGIGALAFLVWNVLPAETKERLGTIIDLSSDYNADANNNHSRSSIWERTLGAVVYRPIGFGVDSFAFVDGTTGGTYKAAHNSFVQITVELGFIGLFLFLMVFKLAWQSLGRVVRAYTDTEDSDHGEVTILARSIIVSLAGNAVCGFFLSMAYAYLMWMLFALTSAILILAIQSKPEILRRMGDRPARVNDAGKASTHLKYRLLGEVSKHAEMRAVF